jgi:hypothetical protein
MTIVYDSESEPLLLFDNENLLARVNPDSENIGIFREVMGEDRWFFDCASCDVGSQGFTLLSATLVAINAHVADKKHVSWLDLRQEKCNNSSYEQGDSPLAPNPTKGA